MVQSKVLHISPSYQNFSLSITADTDDDPVLVLVFVFSSHFPESSVDSPSYTPSPAPHSQEPSPFSLTRHDLAARMYAWPAGFAPG